MRRTFISLLLAIGEDVPYVMGPVGHADPKMTLSIYAQVMFRGDGERERLQSIVQSIEWAQMGTNPEFGDFGPSEDLDQGAEKPAISREEDDGRGWFRTSDLSRVKRSSLRHDGRQQARSDSSDVRGCTRMSAGMGTRTALVPNQSAGGRQGCFGGSRLPRANHGVQRLLHQLHRSAYGGSHQRVERAVPSASPGFLRDADHLLVIRPNRFLALRADSLGLLVSMPRPLVDRVAA